MPSRHLTSQPQTDLQELYKKVIRGPRSSAYPKNLSDQWLRLIARDMAQIRKQYTPGYSENNIGDTADFPGYLVAPKLLISKLLAEYLGRPVTDADWDRYDLRKCINNYWTAVSDEILMREIGVEFSPLTLEVLFFATRKIC